MDNTLESLYRTPKCKLKDLFGPQECIVINHATERVNQFMIDVGHFVKYSRIEEYECHQDPKLVSFPTYNELTTLVDLLSKGKTSTRTERPIDIEKEGDEKREERRKKKRVRILGEKQAVTKCYERFVKSCGTPLSSGKSLKNLKYIIDYNLHGMITSYETNIQEHFIQYLTRVINKECLSIYLTYKGWKLDDHQKILGSDDQEVSKEEKDEMWRELRKVKNDVYLYRSEYTCNPIFHTWIEFSRGVLYPIPGSSGINMKYDLKARTKLYFGYMIVLNRRLEDCEGKLFQVFCRYNMIPKYIKIDTTGLIDLLVDKSKLNELKVLMGLNADSTKKDLYDSFNTMRKKHKSLQIPVCDKLDFRVGQNYDEVCTYNIKRSVWDYFVRFNRSRKTRIFLFHNDFMFNNSISTDGYSVSVSLAHKTVVGKDRKERKKISEELDTDCDVPYLDSLSEEELEKLKESTLLYCDPGKKNIIYVTDGKRKDQGGKHFRYTYVQRRYECAFKQNRRGLIQKKAETRTNKNRTVKEAEEAITYNSKSCYLNSVQEFIIQYRELQKELGPFYKDVYHRKCRYRSYVRKQCSELRLLDNIEKKFKEDDKEVVIVIGDWSTSHHLKGFAPTPGIGMRRLLKKRFGLYFLNEWGTSKRCHHCHHDTDYVKSYTYKKDNELKTRPVHGLLGCTNQNCRKLWNRDVNATANQCMLATCILRGEERPEAFRRKLSQSTSSGGTSTIIAVFHNNQA